MHQNHLQSRVFKLLCRSFQNALPTFQMMVTLLLSNIMDQRCLPTLTNKESPVFEAIEILRLFEVSQNFLFFLFACFWFFVFIFCFFEIGFFHVALAVLKLCRPGWPQTQKSACLCLPSAGIKGVCHHRPAKRYSFKRYFQNMPTI